MRHFVYKHMPGVLGLDDPYRPHASGGIGHGIFLVIVTNYEIGVVELKWYYGNPSAGWAIQIGEALWSVGTPDTIWEIHEPTVQPWEDPEQVWSVLVGDQLWSVWNPTMKWSIDEPESKWAISMEERWAFTFGTKWVFGKVMS